MKIFFTPLILLTLFSNLTFASNIEKAVLRKYAMADNQLLGEWILQSFHLVKNHHNTKWAPNITGTLLYSPDNFMSVAINGFTVQDQPIREKYLLYSGQFKISEQESKVYHQVKNASNIDRIGKTMVREYKLSDDNNTLTLIGHISGGQSVLVWKRKV